MTGTIGRRELLQSGILALGAAAGGVALPALAQPAIRMREIPATGERLPVIGLGTAATFDVDDSAGRRAALREVLASLLDAGGTVVDTSPMYGAAERVLGELTADLPGRDRLFLACKVWVRGRQEGIEQMRASLAQLGRDSVDLMQVHNLVDWRTHLATLRSWKDEGRIRYLGITHWREDAYREVMGVLRREPMDFLQINYSLLTSAAADELLPAAAERGIAVLVNRPFDGGEAFRVVEGHEVPEWAREAGMHTWGQYFLKYALAHPAVTAVLTGTREPAHMLENLAAGTGELPDAALLRRMREHVLGLV